MLFTTATLIFLCLLPNLVTGATRVYYIAAEEIYWDYLPVSTDLARLRNKIAEPFLRRQENPLRLGHVYKKAVFREYTDGTYTKRKPRYPSLGILGPVLMAEVGDILELHLLNKANYPVSLHTHGAEYTKSNEGAFYLDNTVGRDKLDDSVFPGQNYTYFWTVTPERGPTASDDNCLVWAYHSHMNGDADIHVGLIGSLLLCKEGFLDSYQLPSVIANSFFMLFMIFDENQSWYLDENIAMTATGATQNISTLKTDPEFQRSNLMYSINGYMYNNLPGLNTCQGSTVTWYLIGFGNEIDMHAATFSGHTITFNGHRRDVVQLFPGMFGVATMLATHKGRWSTKSKVADHYLAGMEAAFQVRNCLRLPTFNYNTFPKRIRKYNIAAEEVFWNYAPSGMNKIKDIPLLEDSDAIQFFEKGPNRLGGTYKKALYKEYEDEHFLFYKPQPESLGFLGPTLRAEVGDILQVNFLNRATRPYSIYSEVLVCEGCTPNATTGCVLRPVYPGQRETFSFVISENLGPTKYDPQCVTWRYFSNVDAVKDTYSGLNGFLLICRPGTLTDDGIQKNFDKEYGLMFVLMDENQSHYLEENIALFADDPSSIERDDGEFINSNMMHAINGLTFGNLIGLDLCIQDMISWHLMAIGHQQDLHVVHFRGSTFLHKGNYKDSVEMLPGTQWTVTMLADALGEWPLECRTNDHMRTGMETLYSINVCGHKHGPPAFHPTGKIRNYYIAAEEEEWDYAPVNIHPVTGERLTENVDSRLFVVRDATHIGSRYKKVLYHEYTDCTFTQRKPRLPENEHLGILGPLIRAEVGDVVRVVFWNNASRNYNIRPHGLLAWSNVSPKKSNPVKPGGSETFYWEVPPRSGPSNNGFNCTTWVYYSTCDTIKDTHSGLVGPLIVCKPGTLNDAGKRKDIDREFSVLYSIFEESESWYLDENIEHYIEDPNRVDKNSDEFQYSNAKFAINGRIFGNLYGLVGNVGEKIAWYMIGLGSIYDIHSAHFHGLSVVEKNDAFNVDGRKLDVVQLLPGIVRTTETTFDVPGKWMFHCHVDDHLKNGMLAIITVNNNTMS